MGIENVKKVTTTTITTKNCYCLGGGGGGGGELPPKSPGKKNKKKTESLGIEPTIISNMAFILFCIVSANEKVKMGEA